MDIELAQHCEQIVAAFRDVEDQLLSLRLLANQADAKSRAAASATRTTLWLDSRYRSDLVSQPGLLDARRSELSNRRRALLVPLAQHQVTAGLIRAQAGRWGFEAGFAGRGRFQVAWRYLTLLGFICTPKMLFN